MRILLLLAIGIFCFPLNGRMHGHVSYFHLKKKVSVEVTELAVDKTPSWLENSENPPLSAKQAIQKASKFKDTIVVDTKDEKWVLRDAALCPFHGEKWYWLIRFEAEPFAASFSGVPHDLKLAVLMDGTVVKPEVVDRNEDEK